MENNILGKYIALETLPYLTEVNKMSFANQTFKALVFIFKNDPNPFQVIFEDLNEMELAYNAYQEYLRISINAKIRPDYPNYINSVPAK
jgi:hypothetical protein